MMPRPRLTPVRRDDTHRLIPSKHTETVLLRVADDDAHLQEIFELDSATNDRLLAEHDRLPGIGPQELVVGVPHAAVVNAAFCHPHPLGGRFNGPERGAWYAAFELDAAQAEVAFHKSVELAEIDRWDESVTYDDYLADFDAEFHDLRDDPAFADCLSPLSYVAARGPRAEGRDVALHLARARNAGHREGRERLSRGELICRRVTPRQFRDTGRVLFSKISADHRLEAGITLACGSPTPEIRVVFVPALPLLTRSRYRSRHRQHLHLRPRQGHRRQRAVDCGVQQDQRPYRGGGARG